ncbi:hypothetical protein ABZ388_12145 [Micromonospora parva]|uniref:NACHT domain-containing protein n=1 Tax=Micromonospora parva TaxID=1464048 RepID=A0ABW6VSH0_9ACTN|nr:hypothetical protein [Micromonospora parva]
MRPGSRRRVLRWTAGALVTLLSAIVVVTTATFVPAYMADKTLSNKAGYLGTILGAVSLLAFLVQQLIGLVRRDKPAAVIEQLRSELLRELSARLRQLRRTSEHIALSYRSAGESSDVQLEALAQAALRGPQRAVLLGHPGRGKSYTALQVALEILKQDPAVVPLVVPAGRWIDGEEIDAWLPKFIATEFNVSRGSAQDLIESGRIFPVLDGIDELCIDETTVEPAERLLRQLAEWRLREEPARFLATCRRATWSALDQNLRDHYTLQVYTIRPVGYAEATRYLSRSIGGADVFAQALDLATSLQDEGRGALLASPWQLSLIAELARNRLATHRTDPGRTLVTTGETANAASLVANYVESVGTVRAALPIRLRNVLDLWWLSHYAKYLELNRSSQRVVAGRTLPARDIILHRLWPVAGRAALVTDFILCVLLSVPGFVWAAMFLWDRGWIARGGLLFGAAVWSAMLIRTSTKPWMPAATPDWSRLTDLRFSLRQTATALVIAVAAWLVLGPWIALISFVTAWLAIGLTVGFGQTLATDTRPEIVGPLGVLRRERTVSRLSAAVMFPILAWGFSLQWGVLLGVPLALLYCAVVGETVACALWRRYVAMIVAAAFRLPLAPARFLQRMCGLGFVRVAGIAYQFRHDELLRYFANTYDVRDHFRRSWRTEAPQRYRTSPRPVVE